MPPKLVLASTSRYRRQLLDALGVEYVAKSPSFEEVARLGLSAEAMAIEFAREKAESLRGEAPDALIIGADQTAELDGRILGKPGSLEGAIAQLGALSGRTHRLYSAVALHDVARRRTEHRLMVHEMRMRALSRAQIEAYVARDRPLDCAGSYKVEALGVVLFEEMRGVDHTAIVGLPITAVAELLARAGFDLLTEALGRT